MHFTTLLALAATAQASLFGRYAKQDCTVDCNRDASAVSYMQSNPSASSYCNYLYPQATSTAYRVAFVASTTTIIQPSTTTVTTTGPTVTTTQNQVVTETCSTTITQDFCATTTAKVKRWNNWNNQNNRETTCNDHQHTTTTANPITTTARRVAFTTPCSDSKFTTRTSTPCTSSHAAAATTSASTGTTGSTDPSCANAPSNLKGVQCSTIQALCKCMMAGTTAGTVTSTSTSTTTVASTSIAIQTQVKIVTATSTATQTSTTTITSTSTATSTPSFLDDKNNCGSCGNVCAPGNQCNYGVCAPIVL